MHRIIKEIRDDMRLWRAQFELSVTQWLLAAFVVITLVIQIVGWSTHNRINSQLVNAVNGLTEELKRFE